MPLNNCEHRSLWYNFNNQSTAAPAAPGYAAPEQLRGGPADRRTDVFTLGVILWECLAVRPLHGGLGGERDAGREDDESGRKAKGDAHRKILLKTEAGSAILGESRRGQPIARILSGARPVTIRERLRALTASEVDFDVRADMYGDGKVADSPGTAKAMADPFYMHPEKAKARIDAAIAKLKTYPQVDTANIGAIGYCFGGGILINTARLGDELKAIVSFHGSLLGTPAKKGLLKTKLLVLHGNADPLVNPQVAQFKKQMDSIGADYKFIGYDSAMHAFTNPASTENGKKFKMPIAYNAAADTASSTQCSWS